MCLFGTSSKVAGTWADIISSHCWLAGGGWENKPPGLPFQRALGEGPGTKRQQLVSELGKNRPSQNRGWNTGLLASWNPASATVNSYKRRATEKWEGLQPWPGGSPPPAHSLWAATPVPQLNRQCWAENSVWTPGHPHMPVLDQWKPQTLVSLRSASKKKFAPGITLMPGRKASMERFAYLFWINHMCLFKNSPVRRKVMFWFRAIVKLL